MFRLVQVPSFSSDWQFLFLGTNSPKKGISGQKEKKWKSFPMQLLQNVGISPLKFPIFNSFVTLCHQIIVIQIIVLMSLCCHSQIIEIKPGAPLKENMFFWSNLYKIEMTITSLIVMLELPNFGRVIKFFWWRPGQKSWRHNLHTEMLLFSEDLQLANFADIIKILTMFVETSFKRSKKLKGLQIMCSNAFGFSLSKVQLWQESSLQDR